MKKKQQPTPIEPPKVNDPVPADASFREVRCIQDAELRAIAPKDGKPGQLVGYAAVYNSLSKPLPIEDSQGKRSYFRERIAPGAFARALAAGADVRALVNHEPVQLLGRTTAGTLRLMDDEKGFRFETDVPDTQAGRDAMVSVERKDMTGCSFGFRTIKDSWGRENGEMIRTLIELDTIDVGPVTFPAYEETSVDVRSVREAIAKLPPAEEAPKPTIDELRAKTREQFDTEHRAMMEYDDPSLIWCCRSAIQYFRMAFDYAQGVMDTIEAVAGELTDQDRQAVDDCLSTIGDLVSKARDCKAALSGLGAVDVAEVEMNSELRVRVQKMTERGLTIPAELRTALEPKIKVAVA